MWYCHPFFQTLNAIAQGCRLNQRPMGGLQVIFTGDFFQLPPISNAKGNSKNNLNFSCSQREISRSTKFVPSPKKFPAQRIASTDKISSFFQPSNKSKSNLDVISSQTSESNATDDKYTSMSQQVRESDTSILRFCFQSPAWNEIVGGNTFKLSTVFRQSETVFASLLNSIRYGELTGMIMLSKHVLRMWMEMNVLNKYLFKWDAPTIHVCVFCHDDSFLPVFLADKVITL